MAIKCPKCQAENPETVKFCSECGTQIPSAKTTRPEVTETLQTPVKELTTGSTFVGRYQVIEELGKGGMGVVYKAEDTKLKRTVALKFLPSELTRDLQAKKRFLQEAQAAAALDHPNICAVFEISETEGATYIVMPYVKGRNLKEKIASGPLSMEEALDIAGQVGEGLKEAHEKGIIHRDIKPANIMLTEKGQAKIMDFGLAKLTAVADVTKTLIVMGTIAYMSPEQARGEVVDYRTDIWSFGAILYEMLTGQMPFGRKQDQALIYSILNDTLEPVSRLRSEIPSQLERIVQEALEKDKSRRYQNMTELLKDLKYVRAFGLAIPKVEKSIVVLPFEDISPGKDNEYFSDGLTEEIIADLSHVHDLLVISRSSAMTFKGTKKTIPEIARTVNVRYVLEGGVRKSGNNLRITAQLIDGLNDAHLWAEKYSGTLDDVFDIQEKVSRSIVRELELRLTQEANRKMSERPVPSFFALDCYMKAKHEIWKFTQEGYDNALEYLQQGLDTAGGNAVLYAAMAWVYWKYGNLGIKSDELYLQKAEEYAKRALELDPESPEGLLVISQKKGWAGDPQYGVRTMKRALAADPNNSDVMMWLTCFYAMLDKPDAALPLIHRMAKLEPLSPMSEYWQGLCQIYSGRFDIGLELLQNAFLEFPDDFMLRVIYGLALAYVHRVEDAVSVLSKLVAEQPNNFLARICYLIASVSRAPKSDILSSLEDPSIKAMALRDFAGSFFLSEIYAQLDEKEKTLEWLEHAVNLGFINYPFLNEYDPFLAGIRGEERFQKLMERVKYEWEHFEV